MHTRARTRIKQPHRCPQPGSLPGQAPALPSCGFLDSMAEGCRQAACLCRVTVPGRQGLATLHDPPAVLRPGRWTGLLAAGGHSCSHTRWEAGRPLRGANTLRCCSACWGPPASPAGPRALRPAPHADGCGRPGGAGNTNRASGRDSGERRMGPTRRNGPQTPAPAGRCPLKGAGDSAGLRRAGGRAGLGHRSHGLVALHTRSAASSHRPGCGPISPAGHVLGPSWPGALPPLLSPTSSLRSWCRAVEATAGTSPRAAGFPRMAQAPGLHCPLPGPQPLRLSEQSSRQGPGGGAAWR
ncbi:collagen alpha-2(I) chain-like [Canis lupus familiaris]|uniref:collagen alpha-2(I) chain-like n=1 Tax=Canis lupus familiaris TaxID=9615 RepID=UPI0018F5A82E|nr:collagen alpha-2(I) chain-like [Canis lupus familiaris]